MLVSVVCEPESDTICVQAALSRLLRIQHYIPSTQPLHQLLNPCPPALTWRAFPLFCLAAVDILLQRLQSLTLQPHGSVSEVQIRAAMDIPTLVADLRKQRRGSVQTSGQYAFIWRALMDELEQLLGQDME